MCALMTTMVGLECFALRGFPRSRLASPIGVGLLGEGVPSLVERIAKLLDLGIAEVTDHLLLNRADCVGVVTQQLVTAWGEMDKKLRACCGSFVGVG